MTSEKRFNCEIKAFDEKGFEGYASTFFTLDRHNDIIMPGAYKANLKSFLDNNFIGGSGHDWNNPVGKYYDANEDSVGLYVKAKYSDVPDAHNLRTLINDGVIKGLSVGMEIEASKMVSPKEVKAIWQEAGYEPDRKELRRLGNVKSVRLITSADLIEVSPVTVPANPKAQITSFKSAPGDVAAYCSRVLQTARSIHAQQLKNGIEDERLGAIYAAVTDLSIAIEEMIGKSAEAEPDPTPEPEPETKAAETPGDDLDLTVSVKAQFEAAMQMLGS